MTTSARLIASTMASAAVAFAVLLGFPGQSDAQTYPDRPVKMIVPFGAGTSTDSVARLLGEELAKLMRVPVIVENIPGASGILGAQAAARAAPDGYTLLVTTSTTHAANGALYKKIPYDPVKDFEHITKVVEQTVVVVVRSDSPFRDIDELLAGIRSRKSMTFASGNASSRLASEMIKAQTNGNLLHVPYKAVPQALIDLMGGQVDFMSVDPTTAMPLVKSGKLRALAITSSKRDVNVPGIPTLAESGLQGLELTAWGAVFAPAGTPAAIVNQLNSLFIQVLAKQSVKDRLLVNAQTTTPTTPQELRAFVASESVKWARSIKAAGIEPE